MILKFSYALDWPRVPDQQLILYSIFRISDIVGLEYTWEPGLLTVSQMVSLLLQNPPFGTKVWPWGSGSCIPIWSACAQVPSWFLVQVSYNIHSRRQQLMAYMCYCQAQWRPALNSQFQASALPSPRCFRYLGSEPADSRLFLSLSPSLSLLPFSLPNK